MRHQKNRAGTRGRRVRPGFVVLAVLIGVSWIGLRLVSIGDGETVLLSDGPHNPAHPLIEREFNAPYQAARAGFDGAQFYAIARSPIDVREAATYLDQPSYRLRRILYPAIAGMFAPRGGTPLIWSLALVSLVGVALGAWALGRLPGAPPWLPLTMVINPGVIAGLWLSLSDVLATGLVLAAFAAAFSRHRRRIVVVIVLLALASLTREISILAAFALVLLPGLSRRDRVLIGVVPGIPVGLWSLYVARVLDAPLFAQPYGGTFTAPFLGWLHNDSTPEELVLAAAMGLVLAASLTKWRSTPLPVTAYVALSLGILVCSTPIIMDTWMGSTRVITAALPLAIWTLVGRPSKRRHELAPDGTGRLAARTPRSTPAI